MPLLSKIKITNMTTPLHHFSLRYFRRLARELAFSLPIFLSLLIFINLASSGESFQNSRKAVLTSPSLAGPHLQLAGEFSRVNQIPLALSELSAARTLSPTLDELQIIAALTADLERRQSSPVEIRRQIAFWEAVVTTYPSYRDAYLRLTVLNWKIYRLLEARKNLDAALAIDPNYGATPQFLPLFN